MDKEIRYYYPYCGVASGFCLSDNGCVPKETPHCWCTHWRAKHPISGMKPQSLYPLKQGRPRKRI